jgi:hypothetical protein
MSEAIQQIVVATAVVGAVLYLALRGRSKKTGGRGCGCATQTTSAVPGNRSSGTGGAADGGEGNRGQ